MAVFEICCEFVDGARQAREALFDKRSGETAIPEMYSKPSNLSGALAGEILRTASLPRAFILRLMSKKICTDPMKVCMAALAGLLRAMAGFVSREAYLRHLETCPQDELRRRLDFKLRSNDVLGAREVMERKEVCSRIRSKGMDGYFAMAGMMVTDGMWRCKYAEAFERSELSVEQDGEMIKKLMGEMVTGEIWRETNARLAEVVAKKMEEKSKNARRANGEGVKPSSVVEHIAPEIEKRLLPTDRTWGSVLGILLRKDEVRTGLVEGKYNEELREMIVEDKKLKHVLYGYLLRRRNVLGAMVDKNEALAREVVADVIEQGCWLYVDELEKVVGTEAIGRLFPGGDVFGKLQAEHGLGGEGLSLARLKVLAREGRLDRLVKRVIERLVRYGEVSDLGCLMKTVEGRVFDEMVASGELDMALREGIEELIRCGAIYNLRRLVEAVRGRVFDGLLSRGELGTLLREGIEGLIRRGEVNELRRLVEIEAVKKTVFDGLLSGGKLDAVLKEGIERLIGRGEIDALKRLIEAIEGRFDVLVSGGELDTVLRERMEKLIREGWMYDLKMLLAIEIVKRRVFDDLLIRRELDTLLRGVIKGLVRHGCIGDLKKLIGIEIVRRRVFDEQVTSGELDLALKEGTSKLIRDRWTDSLMMLVETVEGRFGGLLSRGELDEVLREGVERLVRRGEIDELRRLLGIELVKRRVSGGLVAIGELDAAFRRMAESIARDRGKNGVFDLHKAVKEGVFDGLVSEGELGAVLGETMSSVA